MTIGKSSKKQKAPRSPPFLDRASGFYGRLDEIEIDSGKDGQIIEKQPTVKPMELYRPELLEDQEQYVCELSEGLIEDDGTTLLKRKPSRLSRRWSRKSLQRTKSEKPSLEMEIINTETQAPLSVELSLDAHLLTLPETGSSRRAPEPTIIHFSITEEADDQELIPNGKEKEKEIKEKMKEGDVEKRTYIENMKVVKRNSFRNYRKVMDKALRRGWETFVANLYSVTLSPVSSSVST